MKIIDKVFGGKQNVQSVMSKAIKDKLNEKNLKPEALDEVFVPSDNFPKTADAIANPSLITANFFSAVSVGLGITHDTVFSISQEHYPFVMETMKKYSSNVLTEDWVPAFAYIVMLVELDAPVA